MSLKTRLDQLETAAERRDEKECINPPYFQVARGVYQHLLRRAGHKPGTRIEESIKPRLDEQLAAIDATMQRLDDGSAPDPDDLALLPKTLWPERVPVLWEVLRQGPCVPWRLRHTVRDLDDGLREEDIEQLLNPDEEA